MSDGPLALSVARRTTLVEADCRRFPLGPSTLALAVVGDGSDATSGLAADLGARGKHVATLATGHDPSSAVIGRAVALVRRQGAGVVVTRNAVSSDGQQRLVASLVATGVPTAAVAVADPYEAGVLGSVAALVAVYDDGAPSLAAATQVLLGDDASGTLPVDVPALAPGRVALAAGTRAPACTR